MGCRERHWRRRVRIGRMCRNWVVLSQALLLCSRWRFLAPRLRSQQNRARTTLLFCSRIKASSRRRLRSLGLQLLLGPCLLDRQAKLRRLLLRKTSPVGTDRLQNLVSLPMLINPRPGTFQAQVLLGVQVPGLGLLPWVLAYREVSRIPMATC